MKVKKENIKINCDMNNLSNQSFAFAREIWETESLIDDLDFIIPVDFDLNRKARKKICQTQQISFS